ncbi:uncharacterized protein LOC105433297 [Pogonomyrmex barbatus]|uniref:Uncharacterized protein LOC105433297 n=1 Tax=Pogonomyrmex barbatus TaxID=144034 RepID=A0A6I9WW26_9HYME|nr:uncharacterized protein LOC105433297 [Pogonomyrmex barbatus]
MWRAPIEEMGPEDSAPRTRGIILPHFFEWMSRDFGGLSFRLTQLLTGHECFSVYLKRIGRYYSDGCEHCKFGTDDASHTLADCEAWSFLRNVLSDSAPNDESIVPIMLSSEENWRLVASFAEDVMFVKECAERARQRGPLSDG